MAASPAKPTATAPLKVPNPDFIALNGKFVILDVVGKEGALRIDPKTHKIDHKGGFASTWTVHSKSANVAQLQNFRFVDLYLRVDAGQLAAGPAQDLMFTFKDGHVSIDGAAGVVFTMLDNTAAVDRVLSADGPIKNLLIDWSLLDGGFICLVAPSGMVHVEEHPPAVSYKAARSEQATWEVDFIAPGQITLENQKFDNMFLRVVNGKFEASGTGKVDATLQVSSHNDGTVSFAGIEGNFTVINNPKAKRVKATAALKK